MPNVFKLEGQREAPMERLLQALDEIDDLFAILRHRWPRRAAAPRPTTGPQPADAI